MTLKENCKDSIKLYYSNNNFRGPGQVVQNLIKGLENIGISVLSPNDKGHGKYNCWLQDCFREDLILAAKNNEIRLLGPNLFVLPSDNPELCTLSDNFVVPSTWVKDLYLQFNQMKNKNIHVWPVGVDTKYWTPTKNNLQKKLDCFIYFKNRNEQDLAVVEAICKKFILNYEIIKYGTYNKSKFLELCHSAKFAIVLDSTESQGLFLLEMLSTDLPCYVFNDSTWKNETGTINCKATTVPYFEQNCGEIINDVNLGHFSTFLQNVTNDFYNPRKYILDNFTLEKCAQNYVDILSQIG